MNATMVIGGTFIVYLIFMLSIGAFFYRKNESLSDYFLGGRGLNRWVAALSAQASDMSGWLLLGLPGFAYLAGMEALWIALGLAVGTYLNWLFVARRLRKYTYAACDSITLPDYFANRFLGQSKALRVISALFILVFFLIYTSSGFVAGAKLFNTVFHIPYHTSLLVSVLVIISYTFMGGFMAVSWTDFFQGMIMFGAVLIVPALGIHVIGGWGAFVSQVNQTNPQLLNPFTSADGSQIGWIALVSSLAWGLGYFGQPHILTRFMAIENEKEVAPARRIAMIWVIISLGCAVLIGMVGRFCPGVELAAGKEETVFMTMVNVLTHPLLGGILLAAVLAAVMSTADSQLLVTSSALTEDLYRVWIRPQAGEKELVWVSRFTVVGVAILAFLLASNPESSVLGLVSYAWAGFGATFGPLVLLSLYWNRMTRHGAIAGVISGGLVVIGWKQLSGGIFDLYEIVPGFIVSIVAIIVVSLMDKDPEFKGYK
ncbi:MAG: sodium/proline symporter PutP [Spartobacteria bacterium]|nr:sodium/proline symporter PutP [Spartobacteria bacterium]